MAWSEAEVSRLTKLYPKTRNRDLAVEFGRPLWGIAGKARGLGLKKDYARGYRRQYPLEINLWSQREENLLAELFATTPNEEIAERIGRSLDAIANKARKMGLRKMEFWSEDEDTLLKRLYKKLSYAQLAQQLERTKSAVQIRVAVLGLECKVDNWTENEIDFLEKSYLQMTYRQIGEKLGRTWTAVAAKAERAGLTKNHYWSETDTRKLSQLYIIFSARKVAEIMDRPYSAVRGKIRLLGLRKEAEATQKNRSFALKMFVDEYSGQQQHHVFAAKAFDKNYVSNALAAVI